MQGLNLIVCQVKDKKDLLYKIIQKCAQTRPKSFAPRPRAKQPITEAIIKLYFIYTFEIKWGLMQIVW